MCKTVCFVSLSFIDHWFPFRKLLQEHTFCLFVFPTQKQASKEAKYRIKSNYPVFMSYHNILVVAENSLGSLGMS